MIQYLTFLLVLILAIDRAYQLDYKKLIKFLQFRKRFRSWFWDKVPKSSSEQLHERRQLALNSLLREDLSFLSRSNEPMWKVESEWTAEEIDDKNKREVIWSKIRKFETNLRDKWIKIQKPILYYLIKLRVM